LSYQPGEFSVTQFFSENEYETVRTHVNADEATQAFVFYTSNVAASVGITKRVIITDGGDCINAEWIYGKGLVFGVSPISS